MTRVDQFDFGLKAFLGSLGVPEDWELGGTDPAELGDSTLGPDAIRYVRTGAPKDVLSRVGDAYGTHLLHDIASRRSSIFREKDVAAGRLMRGFGVVEPAIWVRFGHVANAVRAVSTRKDYPGWFAQVVDLLEAASRSRHRIEATYEDLIAVAHAGGWDADNLPILPFKLKFRFGAHSPWAGLKQLTGFAKVLEHRHSEVALFLHDKDGTVRERALRVLDSKDPTSEKFAPDIAHEACGGNADVRDTAIQLLKSRFGPEIARRELTAMAEYGTAPQRRRAFEHLWALATDEDRPAFIALAAADRAASVRTLADEWRRSLKVDSRAELSLLAAEAGPEQAATVTVSLTDAQRFASTLAADAQDAVEKWNIVQLDSAASAEARTGNRVGRTGRMRPDIPATFAADLTDALVSAQHQPLRLPRGLDGRAFRDLLGIAAERSECGWDVVVAAAHVLGCLGTGRYEWIGPFNALTRLQHVGETLRLQRLAAILDELGYPGPQMVWEALRPGIAETEFAPGWESTNIGEFTAANLPLVIDTCLRDGKLAAYTPDYFYDVIATLPWIPSDLAELLFAAALGQSKQLRPRARRALAGHVERTARAIQGLDSTKSGVRAAAAEWLLEIGGDHAVEELIAAESVEKHAATRASMKDAILTLRPGTSQEDQGAVMLAEFARAPARITGAVPWHDFEDAPPVRWASDGSRVPTELLLWVVGTAVRRKSPVPAQTLLAQVSAFDRSDRAEFAEWLLRRWIRDDLEVDAREVAERLRRELTRMQSPFRESMAERYGVNPDRLDELGPDDIPQMLLREPSGSAIALKGILAVVSACADSRVVDPARRYITTHYGLRLAQSKALVAMLAWVDDTRATQAALSIAARFRTRSIQQEAQQQVEALAAYRGWSAHQLADRTIPNAGFEHGAPIRLSYSRRAFSAELTDCSTIVVHSNDGTTLKSLPKPTNGDDEVLAAHAKRTLAGARKELKNVVKAQTDRLYESLCVQRLWTFDEWEEYVVRHPIVRHLASRLVWSAAGKERDVLLRPTLDATYVGVDGVPLPGEGMREVRLAHRVTAGDELSDRWREHFVLANVDPLFDQFLARSPSADGRDPLATSIKDFEGFAIDIQSLRGVLTRRGYLPGEVQDGPSVHDFVKRFAGAGLVATIEFTGSPYPFTDATVAIEGLTFRTESGGRSAVRISDIPPVLLAECSNDLQIAADKGTGFDPGWEDLAR